MNTLMNRRRWLASAALGATALALTRGRGFAAEGRANGKFIYLDKNENPFGFSKSVEEAVAGAVRESNRYPVRELTALRDLIAQREQVSSESVIMGSGCTEVFSLACLRYGADGRESLAAEPTYLGFPDYIQRIRGQLIRVPVNEQWEMDLDAMAKRVTKNTSLVYVCNPNNPTGALVDGAKLRQFCEEQARERTVLVDEAYFELVDDAKRASMVELVRKGANVIVARTFSKIFGLAGLRVGYGIAKPEIIAELRRLQTTLYSVNRLGAVAARAAYLDSEHIALSRQRIAEARAGFYRVLEPLGHKIIPNSQTNFVTFEAKGGSENLAARLQREFSIAVRTFEFLGRSWVRVSMGTREEMDALASALKILSV